MRTLKNGENVWINQEGTRVRSTTRPTGEWFPAWSARRIHGDRYEYYNGSSDWINAANASMKQAANDNFRSRN